MKLDELSTAVLRDLLAAIDGKPTLGALAEAAKAEMVERNGGTELVYMGYTRQQLSDAFDSVKDDADWKNPIRKRIPRVLTLEEKNAISAGVIFFAGCAPAFIEAKDSTTVIAVGYYNAVGI